MYTALVALACLTHSSHGRRLQASFEHHRDDLDSEREGRPHERRHEKTVDSKDALSMFLLALNPARPQLHGSVYLPSSRPVQPYIQMSLLDELLGEELKEAEAVDTEIDSIISTLQSPIGVGLRGMIRNARSLDELLTTTTKNYDFLTSDICAIALERIATLDKFSRTVKLVPFSNKRYLRLIDKIEEEHESLSVSDVVKVFSALAHLQMSTGDIAMGSDSILPARLVKPLFGKVASNLASHSFTSTQLATVLWSLGKLWNSETPPTRLIEAIESESIRLLDSQQNSSTLLLHAFELLDYKPVKLMPKLSKVLVKKDEWQVPGLVYTAEALARWPDLLEDSDDEYNDDALLLTVASHATLDSLLPLFSGRQLASLITSFSRLQKTSILPDGLLDTWVRVMRKLHAENPIPVYAGKKLETSLDRLQLPSSWIKRTSILYKWAQVANRKAAGHKGERSQFADDELREVFNSIDTDGSGDIDMQELEAAIRAINPDADDETITKMIAIGDTDGDKEISFDEFKVIMNS